MSAHKTNQPGPLREAFKFYGADERTVDGKKRVSIPADIRKTTNSLLLMPHPQAPCLLGWSEDQWDWTNTDPQAQPVLRAIKALARHAEADKEGRIGLRPNELAHLHLTEFPAAAVFIGQQTHFEIWSQENWQDEEQKLQASLRGFIPRR